MSQWLDILNATQGVLSQIAGLPTPILRKDGELIDGLDTVPACIISNPFPEEAIDFATENRVLYRYTVVALLYFSQDRSFSPAVNPAFLNLRQSMRDALDKRFLAGIVEIMDANLKFIPPYSYDPTPDTTADVSGVLCTFDCWETRP